MASTVSNAFTVADLEGPSRQPSERVIVVSMPVSTVTSSPASAHVRAEAEAGELVGRRDAASTRSAP